MRPKTKNTNNIFHAQTTKNTKNKTTKKKKQTTTTQTLFIVVIFIAFASTIQFSHNTPPQQTTPNQIGPAYIKG